MANRLICILFALLTTASVAATHVAVLETVSEKGVIGRSEKMFLTDKLRERANKILPTYMGYIVMTRENISAMLPPGKSIEDCEGSCLVETGKNIAADYVAQARVGKFGKQFTITMELYETAGNNLVGSFTARKPDAEGLLDEIEREADRVFQQIVATNVLSFGTSNGISELSTGNEGYQADRGKIYIVNIESTPTGALFSVDGRVNSSCNTTPCDIALPAGKHLFSFSKNMYQDSDVPVDILKNGLKVNVKLAPYFGKLTIDPMFEGHMGNIDEADIKIDGKGVTEKSLQLSVGDHRVQIAHRCYEKVSFNINVKNQSKILFDKKMQPLLGGLNMDALIDGKPKTMPVYVNGQLKGRTPFLEMVPVCAKIQIGKDKKEVAVKLKAGETVNHTYKGSESGGIFVDRRDGKKYRTVKIGKQTWMAQNLNYETAGSYCYGEERMNCKAFGKLYIWDDAQRACPYGWHLPSHNEWATLFSAIGNIPTAGAHLKSKNGWNKGGNGKDTFVFSALPAGFRDNEGEYGLEGWVANFWTSTEIDARNADFIYMYYSRNDITFKSGDKDIGLSIRCVKD